jgi:hypothetical protein
VLLITVGGLAMSVLSAQRSSSEMRRRDMIRAQALLYVERLLGVPYGVDGSPAPTAADVANLFDDDDSIPSGVTLTGLRTPVGGEGWRFRVGGFEADGVWEVEVNGDLDGNGTALGVRGTETPTAGGTETAGDGASIVPMLSEGRPTLLRIEVFFNGVSAARTVRAAPVQGM